MSSPNKVKKSFSVLNMFKKKNTEQSPPVLGQTETAGASFAYVNNITKTNGKNALFIIDPQNDFTDKTDEKGEPKFTLGVPGALKDCEQIKHFISTNKDKIGGIFVSLDTHAPYHIAHSNFWRMKKQKKTKEPMKKWSEFKEERVPIFTSISRNSLDADAKDSFIPINKEDYHVYFYPADKDPEVLEWVKKYTESLEEPKKKGETETKGLTLMVWPDHCLIGTEGHQIEKHVNEGITEWVNSSDIPRAVTYVQKGTNSYTEHYSAFKAEVEVPEDPNTKFNEKLYQELMKYDKIYVCGEARSHCVKHTVEHLVERMAKDDKNKETCEAGKRRVVLLEGAMSDVPNFEALGKSFVDEVCGGTEGKPREGKFYADIKKIDGFKLE